MKIALITDAWQPQVNGVVTTLVELVREIEQAGHQVDVIHPGQFKTRSCPGYAGIDLAVRPIRDLWSGDAGGDGLRHAGRSVSSRRTDGSAGAKHWRGPWWRAA